MGVFPHDGPAAEISGDKSQIEEYLQRDSDFITLRA